tara:strand:- start:281 stop:3181 length:2901 start_codon:yes stop_codon:yes gene_type:complete
MANQLNSSGITLDTLDTSDVETGAAGKVRLYASGSGSDARLYVKSGADTQTLLGIDIDQLSALGGASLHQTQDHFLVSDNGTEKKVTFSNLEDSIFGNISGDATVAAGGALTIAAAAVQGSMLNDDVISGQGALGGATVAQADLLMIDDGPGTVKSVTFSNFEDSIFGNVSGDATVAAGGALTIAANAVEGSMLNTNAISGQTDIGGVLATTDELLVSDNGTLRRTDLSRLSTMLASTGLNDSSGQLEVDVSDFMANGANNYIVTATGTDAMNAEANLTFDGSTLTVAGAISGSSTLQMTGISSFGAGQQCTISAAGLVSSSANSTLHRLTADRIAVNDLDVNNINSNTITQNTLEVSDFKIVAGLSGSSSNMDGGGLQLGGGQNSPGGLGSLVWNNSDLGLRMLSGSTAILKVNSSGVQATGAISGSGACTVLNVTTDKVTAAEAALTSITGVTTFTAGGDLDIGAHDFRASTLTADSMTATRVAFYGADGVLSGDSDMTFATDTLTVTKLGAFEAAGAIDFSDENMTNVDIDSGAIDGVVIGAASAGHGTFDNLTSTGTSTHATVDINGGAIDGTTIGAASQAAGSFTSISGSTGAMIGSGLSVGNSKFVVTNAGVVQAVAGITCTDAISGSSTATFVGALRVGPSANAVVAADGGLTIDHFDADWTNASRTVADLGEVTTVDINGGTVDGATIGAASQAAGSFTTVSGSSTLHVGGIATFGNGVTTVGATGILSSSAAITPYGVATNALMADQAHVGGGYGNSGISLTTAGTINMDGNLKVGNTDVASDLFVYAVSDSDGTAGGHGGFLMGWDGDATNHVSSSALGQAKGTLQVSGTLLMGKSSATADYAIDIATGFGNVRADAFVTYSDRELKKDIAPIEDSLDKVMKLEAVSYNMKHNNRHEIGFVAQDVAKVVPEIVAMDKKGIGRGIDYGRLTSLLAGAVQSQQGQIAELRAEIVKLKE